jgi:hypothetical protein
MVMPLNQWENYIPQNRSGYLDGLALFRKKVSDAADGIQKLRTDYPNFQDVSETIDQPDLGPLLDSIDNLSTAISTLPEPLPPNYQTSIRPLAGAVRIQMQHFFEWTSNVRTIAGSKIGRLEIMSHYLWRNEMS